MTALLSNRPEANDNFHNNSHGKSDKQTDREKEKAIGLLSIGAFMSQASNEWNLKHVLTDWYFVFESMFSSEINLSVCLSQSIYFVHQT